MPGIGREVKDDRYYREIPDKNLPPIGSRVRRGPDWMWNTQDSFGAGTVVGHDYGSKLYNKIVQATDKFKEN